MLEARLPGRFEVRVDGTAAQIPSRPAQSLFAYLLLNSGSAHRRERLAGLLWPESAEESARSNLRHALWRIRKALDAAGSAECLLADDLSVGFDTRTPHRIDVATLQAGSQDVETSEALRERVAAYGGELLPGFYDEWVILERERLKGTFERAMQQLLDQLVRDERWSEVAERAETWIAVGQSPEPAFRALMLAAAGQGDAAGVGSAYRRCAAALRNDLGVEPSPQTRVLYERLTRGEPAVGAAPQAAAPQAAEDLAPASAREAAPAPGGPPYQGLRHFDGADSERFFGREELVARIAARVREQRFVAVIGASGSGKSSLVRAGVIPALCAEAGRDHRVHLLTPTARPLESLAVALTRGAAVPGETASVADAFARDARALRLALATTSGPNADVLLVVDQFEELFTECDAEAERRAFVDNLLQATGAQGPASLVLTLRADFYAECARYPALRELLAAHQEYIGPMTAPELRRAIEEPARVGDWAFEPGLVDLILRDVGDEPGALPLLSHALLETWERRSGRAMTLRSYAESGGVQGAIARTAETVYNQRLDAGERDIARLIFLRLAAFGDGSQSTRRRVSIRELTQSPETRPVVERVLRILADARLVTVGVETVEVAHEALFSEWPALRQWLSEDRDGLRIHRHLTLAAQEWDATGRESGDLYRGARLGQAQEWAATRARDLNPLEWEFLEASVHASQRAIAERDERQRTELAAARQRALMLGGAFVIAVVLAGVALFFAEQAQVSATSAQIARQRALLESGRSAAASIDGRLRTLRDAMNAGATAGLMFQVQTSDPGLADVLSGMRNFGGDVAVLFATRTRSGEIIAPDYERAGRVRAERARDAVAGSLPEAEQTCRELARLAPIARASAVEPKFRLIFVSAPYLPAPGDTPSVAMIKYDQQCLHALIAEVSLRRAGEWMAGALAPDDDGYLIDGTGRLLAQARRTESDYFRDLSRSDVVAEGLASPDPIMRYAADPLDGDSRLVSTAPVGDTGWRVIVVRSASASQRGLEESLDQLRLLGLLLAVLLLAASAVALILRRGRPARGPA